MSSRQIITDLKQAQQDYEWYPTTNEIIRALVEDLRILRLGAQKALGCHIMEVFDKVCLQSQIFE